jgi:hypothetical protein
MPFQWPYSREKAQKAQGSQKDDDVGRTRTWLAYIVLLVCAIGIIVAAVTAIVASNKGDREAITRLVFVSVLPLFGTWVGTVLAFYFAARNLEAATASTRSITESTARLAGVAATTATSVSEKMIPRTEMKVLSLSEDEAKALDQLQFPLKRIWDEFQKIKLDRLPILGPGDTIKALAHRSLITGFAARQSGTLPTSGAGPTSLDGKNVSDLSDDEQTLLLKTFALVSATATLGEARTRMRVVPRCHDVIVTQTGTETEPVLGWLTDTDLATLPD